MAIISGCKYPVRQRETLTQQGDFRWRCAAREVRSSAPNGRSPWAIAIG